MYLLRSALIHHMDMLISQSTQKRLNSREANPTMSPIQRVKQ